MPTPPLETFLELEDQLRALSLARWQRALADVWEKVTAALGAGDLEEVYRLIDGFTLPERSEASRNKALLLGKAALAFGAEYQGVGGGKQVLAEVGPGLIDTAIDQQEDVERDMARRAIPALVRREVELLIEAQTREQYVQKNALAVDWSKVHTAALEGTRAVSSISSNLTTSRLANYGALMQIRIRGEAEFKLEATLDNLTSKICKRMHGKKFRVAESMDRLERALHTAPEQMKQVHPWIPGRREVLEELETLTNAELEAKGWHVPPFHPHCRTVVVRVSAKIQEASYTPVARAPVPVGTGVFNAPTGPGLKGVNPYAGYDDAFGKATSDAFEEGLEGVEKAALKAYSTTRYGRINDYLRKGTGDEADTVALMDAIMDRQALASSGTVHRGLVTDLYRSLKVGDTIKDNAFMSTAMSRKAALKFFEDRKVGDLEKVFLMIRVRKGQKAIPISKVGPNVQEGGILLPRGTQLRITHVEMKGGTRYVTADIVNKKKLSSRPAAKDPAPDKKTPVLDRSAYKEYDQKTYPRAFTRADDFDAAVGKDGLASLEYYLDSEGARRINQVLRTGRARNEFGEDLNPGETAAVRGHAATLKATMSKTPLKTDTVLWRGLHTRRYADLKVGDEIFDKGFVSTSVRRETAEGFSTSETASRGARRPVLLKIYAPKGTPALPVSRAAGPKSFSQLEKEALLPPGSRFKIISRTDDPAGPVRLEVRLLTGADEVTKPIGTPAARKAFADPGKQHVMQSDMDTYGRRMPRSKHDLFEGPDGAKWRDLEGYSLQSDAVLTYMRTGKLLPEGHTGRKSLDEIKRIISSIDDLADAHKTTKAGFLYRGMRSNKMAKLEVGEEFTDPAIISTSRSRGVGTAYSDYAVSSTGTELKGTEVLVRIYVKKGQKTIPVDQVSRHVREAEVALPRGTRFKVVSKETREITSSNASRTQKNIVVLNVEALPPKSVKAAAKPKPKPAAKPKPVKEVKPEVQPVVEKPTDFKLYNDAFDADDLAALSKRATPKMTEAVKNYTTDKYNPVNELARTGKIETWLKQPGKSWLGRMTEKEARALSRELDKALDLVNFSRSGYVYRGLGTDRFSTLKVGDNIVDKGYVSASVDRGKALEFTIKNAEARSKTPVLMRIEVDRSTKGYPVSRNAPNPDEAEVLLPKNQTFKIVSRSKEQHAGGEVELVTVRIVPKKGAAPAKPKVAPDPSDAQVLASDISAFKGTADDFAAMVDASIGSRKVAEIRQVYQLVTGKAAGKKTKATLLSEIKGKTAEKAKAAAPNKAAADTASDATPAGGVSGTRIDPSRPRRWFNDAKEFDPGSFKIQNGVKLADEVILDAKAAPSPKAYPNLTKPWNRNIGDDAIPADVNLAKAPASLGPRFSTHRNRLLNQETDSPVEHLIVAETNTGKLASQMADGGRIQIEMTEEMMKARQRAVDKGEIGKYTIHHNHPPRFKEWGHRGEQTAPPSVKGDFTALSPAEAGVWTHGRSGGSYWIGLRNNPLYTTKEFQSGIAKTFEDATAKIAGDDFASIIEKLPAKTSPKNGGALSNKQIKEYFTDPNEASRYRAANTFNNLNHHAFWAAARDVLKIDFRMYGVGTTRLPEAFAPVVTELQKRHTAALINLVKKLPKREGGKAYDPAWFDEFDEALKADILKQAIVKDAVTVSKQVRRLDEYEPVLPGPDMTNVSHITTLTAIYDYYGLEVPYDPEDF